MAAPPHVQPGRAAETFRTTTGVGTLRFLAHPHARTTHHRDFLERTGFCTLWEAVFSPHQHRFSRVSLIFERSPKYTGEAKLFISDFRDHVRILLEDRTLSY